MKSCNKVNFAIEISKTFFRPNSYTFRFVCIPLYTWHERQIYISKSVKVLPFDTPHWGTRTSGSSLPKLRHWDIIIFLLFLWLINRWPKLRHWEISFFYYFFDSSIDRPLSKWTTLPIVIVGGGGNFRISGFLPGISIYYNPPYLQFLKKNS